MPIGETAAAIARYLGAEEAGRRRCREADIRRSLGLSSEAYQAGVDELVDYGLVSAAQHDTAGTCLALTAAGRAALQRGLSAQALPLTPAALGRNPLVAASWTVDRVVGAQELPEGREALAAEIVRALEALLPVVQECMPAEAMETIRPAAETLIAALHGPELRPTVIRSALRVFGFPEGAPTFYNPLVAALPGLAAAIDTLLRGN